MYKLVAALLVALVAALTALVAGIMSEARLETALFRSLVCFLVVGSVAGVGVIAFERFGLQRLMGSFMEEFNSSEDKKEPLVEDEEQAAEEKVDTAEEAGEGSSDGEKDGFVPLSADDLRRVPI